MCVILVCGSTSILLPSFDDDLMWKSSDLNQDRKPDGPRDIWIVAARSSDAKQTPVSGRSKNGVITLASYRSRIKWGHTNNS